MKKIYLVLMGVAALSFATLSCSKEAVDPSQQEQNQKEETVKDEPAKEDPSGDTPVPEGMVRLTFGVSQEGDASANEGDDTKTTWNGSTHGWSEGDQIRIIVGEGNVENTDYVDAKVVDGKVTADVPNADYYYAVYPNTATYTFTKDEGKISVSFGRNQSGTFEDANIMAAKTSKAAASFNFKNMTSILKFTTAVGSPYTKIDFAANDKVRLNGSVSTTFPTEFDVDVTPDTKNDGQIVSTNIAADRTYYLAVLPGTTLSNGIGFKVTKGGAQSTGSLSTRDLSMDRSAVRSIPGAIDDLIHESWFITETGRGKKDGTSWENAGDAARLVQLIYPTQTRGDGQGLTAAWRLHKATIYVAAGTYNIQAANGGDALAPSYNTSTLTATIKGGYPTGLSGTTTTGQDPENNATKFISNQAIANDRMFYAKDCQLCNWTFDGITFTSNPDAVSKTTRGVAFFFNDATSGTLTFRQCIFTELESDSELGGAALDFNSTGKLDVTFERCLFKDNVTSGANAGYGGTIVIERGDQTTIKLIDCEADNNDVTSTNGQGGFLCQRAATVNIQGTTIMNSDSKANGGAIFQQGGVLNISAGTDSTKFIGNKAASKRGGAILCQGELNIDNAAFRSNNGSNGGAIHLEAGAEVVISNSTFKRNTATNGGAIRTDGACLLTISRGVIFENNTGTGAGGALNVRQNCTFRMGKDDQVEFISNSAGNGGGGAIYIDTCGDAEVNNTRFNDNSASSGGAIYQKGASVLTINTCSFSSNKATNGEGGSLYITAGEATIKNSSILSSTASTRGGAISIYQTTTTYVPVSLYNTSIINNTASAGAGGIASIGKNDILMVNCTVSSNSGTNGGGIYVTRYNSDSNYITRLSMVSCTVTNNTASNGCGGIYRDTYGQRVDVYNSIITGNTGTDTNNDVRNAQLLYHVKNSVVADKSYISADRVNNDAPVGGFQWRKSELSNPSAFNVATMLSSLSTDVHSVINVSDNPAKTCGMSYDDLLSLSLSATPTQTVDTSFFTKDQKGNSREGKTTMGAYVGE